jgi:small subunit ribosomal protein S6
VREYETVFVLHPKVDEAGIDREIDGVKQTIADGKGELVGVHKWGRKKLAYQIRNANEGFYVLARFHAEPAVLTELDRRYKLNENVLRHLTVLAAGEPFPPDLRGRERRGPRSDGPGMRGGRRRPPGPPRAPRESEREASTDAPNGEGSAQGQPADGDADSEAPAAGADPGPAESDAEKPKEGPPQE